GIPEHIMAARATFNTIEDAVQAVIMLIQGGIELARVELVDEQSIIQVNEARETDYKVAPTLFLELHGNEAGLKESIEFMEALLAEQNVQEIQFEQDTEARNKLWEARHFV